MTPTAHHVTAVLVAHDGARWLPTALAAVAAQTRAVDCLIAVDTGSRDATPELLVQALGSERIVRLPARTGYAAAVAAGVAAADRTVAATAAQAGKATAAGVPPMAKAGLPGAPATERWLWLLHDDCAPDRGALAALLAQARATPSAGVLGPKLRRWDEPRTLLEVGVTVDRAGRRETGLEGRELDQGQHDGVRNVLAVGTAGMLVRRSLWDRLRGLDPNLPIFGTDVDLGWRANLAGARVLVVPTAIVRHAAAAASGQRSAGAVRGGSLRRTERRGGIYTVLANLPLLAVLLTLPRLVLGGLVGGAGRLALRRRGATDELLAVLAVLGHPLRLLGGRWRRRRTRTLPARSVRHLLADPRLRLRRSRDALAAWGGRLRMPGAPAGGRRSGSHLSELDEPDLDSAPTGLLRALLWRPAVALALALLAVTAAALHPLFGFGALSGGRLLPAPSGASDLWHAYAAAWHPVGAGTAAAAPPYLAVLAAAAGLSFGHAPLAVAVLLLGAVPLAGLSAYAATRRLTTRRALRLWAAATYALLPAATGAVAGGRLDVAVAIVVLPLALSAIGRALVAERRDGWRPAWAGVLGLAVAAAFAPPLYLLAVPPLAGAVLLSPVLTRGNWRRAVRRTLAAVIVLAGPPALLAPWLPALLGHPRSVLAGFGPSVAGLTDPQLRPLDLLLLHPGGPGGPVVWLGAPLLLAALAGLARTRGWGLALAGWGLAAFATLAGVLMARQSAAPLGGGAALPVWPGVPTALAGAGLLLAAVVAADGLFGRLAGRSFGWRQPAAALLVAAAAVVPVLAAVSWLRTGPHSSVQRRPAAVLPAFVVAEMAGSDEARALVLRPGSGAEVRYAVLRGPNSVLGDADLAPDAAAGRQLTQVVADLAAGGGQVAGGLAAAAIRYVYLPPPVDPTLTRALDAARGLSRVAAGSAVLVWQVDGPVGRLVLLPPVAAAHGAAATASGAVGAAPGAAGSASGTVGPAGAVLPSGSTGAVAAIPPGPAGRRLVLAEPVDPRWRATVAGRPLPARTAYGWAQAYDVPATGGRLVVSYDGSHRRHELLAQGALLAVVLLLAAPTDRRREDPATPHQPSPLVVDLRDAPVSASVPPEWAPEPAVRR